MKCCRGERNRTEDEIESKKKDLVERMKLDQEERGSDGEGRKVTKIVSTSTSCTECAIIIVNQHGVIGVSFQRKMMG